MTFSDRAEQALQKATDDLVRQVRRTPIKEADLIRFGFTNGCAKCDHAVRYGYGRTGAPHSEACRKRIYGLMIKTPEGQERIARMSQRQLEFMTEYQELAEKAAQAKGEDVEGVVPELPVPASDVAEAGTPFEKLSEPPPTRLNRQVETCVDKKMEYNQQLGEALRAGRQDVATDLLQPNGHPQPLHPDEHQH